MNDTLRAVVRTEGGGVPWAPEPPSGWTQARIKDAADVINGFPFDSSLFTTDEGHPLIRIRDLGQTETSVNFAGEPVDAAWVHPGDVLIGMDGDFNVERWRGPDALLNQRMCCIRSRGDDDVRFLAYVLPFPLKVINDLTYSTTVKHLSSFQVAAVRFPRPALEVQKRIADSLDSETERIDTLIDRKQRFIHLLLEKRTALITAAVTKGLDPNAKMKDSGVAWLGLVPSHWAVTPLRRVINWIEQGWSPQCESRPAEDDEWSVVKAGIVNGGVFRHDEHKALPADLEPQPGYELRPGDLLVSRANGSLQYIGSASVVPSDVRPRTLLCDKVFRMHLDRGAADPEFIAACLQSRPVRFQIERDATGTSTMRNIGQDTLRALLVGLPALSEQREIVQAIKKQHAEIDRLVEQTHSSIDLLREYRTALVSAAVTGQIDIPGTEASEGVA